MIYYLSVCSGIEAASVAWKPLGWEAVAFAEVEPFPCSVLAHHYPQTPNWGDMTQWKEWPDAAINVLVGGTPCQSFSVAGKRGGMDDARGQLALSFSAIAKRYKPQWIVWENVPGVLSSGGGRDFGAFIQSLVELGYGVCWRVLDAQYFGVAQRRRRVFVVGHLGDWRRAAAVLFERESLQRDSAKGGKARKGIATVVAPSLTASNDPSRSPQSSEVTQQVAAVVGALACNTGPRGHDAGNFACNQAVDAGHLICMAHGQGGAEIRENSSPTLTCNHEAPIIAGMQRSTPAWVQCPEECGDYWCNIHQQHTGDCECPPIDEWVTDPYGMQLEGPAAKQPIVLMDQGGSVMNTLTDGTVGTLRREMHGHEPVVVLPGSGKEDRSKDSGVCPTLKARMGTGGGNVPAVAFAQNQLGEVRTGEVFNTVNTNSNASGRNTPMVAFPANMSATQYASTEGVACNLQARNPTAIATAMQVRRLTPTECERLQGFPDSYTNVAHRGKPAADGPRYKALGNSMAVPCMRWIGERIQKVEEQA
jgi:DNA (cytosine-5)-methyltransferase 1